MSGSELLNSKYAHLFQRYSQQPIINTGKIDRRSREYMLQVGFSQPYILQVKTNLFCVMIAFKKLASFTHYNIWTHSSA